ncbi:rhomboid family intramembrane serine protease [Sediminibacillus halophilus]|uniref:Membrane associated serine protease, rhomboid family n=1 Tax=Sediminibacillus halophilus TaxID=482461 RepID=A0A1G9WR35_9BACI|nr:rhomboid family intramembrane serine protease [Sediminibacillus halophilus]SDM86920.1 Membrane associated serine protease, rhomboid family [Sediminibacillus halophilus]
MFIRNESFRDFIRFYPVVTALVAIQLVVWLLVILGPGRPLFQMGAGVNLFIENGEYWRLITPIFLHDPNGVMHVLFNSFSLVLFGPALEQMTGKLRFLLIYLLTGFAGNLFTFIVDPSAYYVHVGASGAIYGLFGMYMYMVFFRKHLIDRANAQIVTTILIIGLIMTFLRPGINILGHLFGFIGGLALAPIFLNNVKPFAMWRNNRSRSQEGNIHFDPNRWNKRRIPWKKYLVPALWVFIGLLVVLGVLGRFF